MKQAAVLAIFFLAAPLFADYQFEFKGYDVLGESRSGSGVYKSNAGLLYGVFNATLPLSPAWDILLSEELDDVLRLSYDGPAANPVDRISPFSEKKLPSSNNVAAGLRFTGLGTLSLSFKNMEYWDALPIYPEFLQTNYVSADPNYVWSGDMVKRQSRNNINAYWLIPISDFSVLADINYFGLNYSLDQGGANINTFTDTVFGSWSGTYQDLWSRFSLGWAIDPAFNLSAGVLNKSDLNDNSKYDLHRYTVQMKGNQVTLGDNNFTWSLSGRWYESEQMKENGFAVGPAPCYMPETFLRLIGAFFLKGR